jgi:hypothetical protein
MKLKPFLISLLLVLLTGTLSSAAPGKQAITMNLPSSVVKEAITKSLPLQFPIDSDTIVGTIVINKIEKLQFKKNKISSYITITGHKLHIVTSIAGHNLRMKIGTLTTSFQCDTTVRFDAARQILYLRPVITNLRSTDQSKTDVASAIVLLFNNQELPLEIEKLKPIVTDTGSKLLSLSMNIANIAVRPESLFVNITPIIKATQKQTKKRN